MEERIPALGIYVNIWRGGAGEPLFVLTGWNGSFPENKDMLVALSSYFDVYGIELPGIGQSDAPPQDWSFDDFIPLINAVFAHYGIEKGMVLGHSFGCVAALKFARYFPQRVHYLILSNSPILSPKNFWGARRVIYFCFLVFTVLVAWPCWLISKAMPFRGGIFVSFIRRYGRQYPYLTRSSGIMRKILRVAIEDDTVQDARNVEAPTYIVWSERGWITPLRNAKALRENLRNHDFVVIPGAPHDFRGVWAQKFSEIVRDWVAQKNL